MMEYQAYPNTPILPWTETDFDRRFRKILLIFLLVFIAIGAAVPFLSRPDIKPQSLNQVAPRLAKLILQKKQTLKPKPQATVKKEEPKKAEKAKPKPEKKKKAQPKDESQQARKKAQRSGLLAMQDELADLRESFDVSSLNTTQPISKSGKQKSQTRNDNILGTRARSGSQGINTGSLSKATGGTALSGRTGTQVSSHIKKFDKPSERAGNGRAARSQEEIELVFQQNKGAIYSLYNRALRKDPSLQGKVLLELTISADGSVIRARIVSSELNAPKLEKRLVSRIKLFKFSRRDVDSVTVTYPIDFLPS
ncbi:MAG: TonB family protein [Gammaproteobacteria bacterium]|nr:TonB family protein [Gammaproteobacteria bacterium]